MGTSSLLSALCKLALRRRCGTALNAVTGDLLLACRDVAQSLRVDGLASMFLSLRSGAALHRLRLASQVALSARDGADRARV